MKKNKKIYIIIGTRPEAIKMAPVINALNNSKQFNVKVFLTGQHADLIKPMLNLMKINISAILLKNKSYSLSGLASKLFAVLDKLYTKDRPDLVMVHGDTLTTFAASTSAFFAGIKVAHIEAGLRTHDLLSPFPEEFNRIVTSYASFLHFAPTKLAKQNLINQGIAKKNIYVTGNTVVDSLHQTLQKIEDSPKEFFQIISRLNSLTGIDLQSSRLVLITGHRRESFGDSFKNIFQALKNLANKHQDIFFIYPVHLNPNVRGPAQEMLSNIYNIKLIEPLNYKEFISLLNLADLVITDSGGIQEECPSLGKPLILMREKTERPEILNYKHFKLAGTSASKIYNYSNIFLKQNIKIKPSNIFGDGKAAERILNILTMELL